MEKVIHILIIVSLLNIYSGIATSSPISCFVNQLSIKSLSSSDVLRDHSKVVDGNNIPYRRFQMRPLNAANWSPYASRIRNIILVVSSLVLASFLSAGKLYDTADDVPAAQIKSKATLYGMVVKVLDGDTFRLRHMPTFFSDGKFKGLLSEKTISVRIAAVDTPETAKFGQTGQPLGDVATEFTKSKLLNKKVAIKLLSRDKYNRIIASVTYDDFLFSKKDISEELLRNGLAVVYRQGNAQYGSQGIQKWNEIENYAKKRKLGVWSLGKGFESPSEYKTRNK